MVQFHNTENPKQPCVAGKILIKLFSTSLGYAQQHATFLDEAGELHMEERNCLIKQFKI